MHSTSVNLKQNEIKDAVLGFEKWHNVILHGIAVGIVVLVHYLENDPIVTLFTGGVICTIVYSYIAYKEAYSSHLRITPLSFYMAWYSIGMGPSAIYAATQIRSGTTLMFVIRAIEPKDVAEGYVLFVIGSLFVHLGIEHASPKREDRIIEYHDDEASIKLKWLVGLWGLGLVASFYPDFFSWMGSFAAIIQRLTPAAVIYIALNDKTRFNLSSYVYNACIVVGTGGAFLASLMSNSKAGIMFSFLPVVWMFVFRRHLWRYLAVFLVVLAGFYFFVVAPVVMTSRLIEMKDGETYAERIIRVYNSLEVESYRSVEEYKENGFELFLTRQFDPPAIGFLIEDVREFGYRGGETMQRVIYSFIPRIIWPEKPTVTVGGWFYMYTGGQKEEGDTDTSVGITATGECYWNFGIPGVIIGMTVIGWTFGFLWRLAGADPRQSLSQILLYFTLVLSVINTPDWVTVITGNVILSVVFIGIVFIKRSFAVREA